MQNKMRLDKCDVYTAKETLEYRERKTYVAAREPSNVYKFGKIKHVVYK